MDKGGWRWIRVVAGGAVALVDFAGEAEQSRGMVERRGWRGCCSVV